MLLARPDFASVTAIDGSGRSVRLTREEAAGALLTIVDEKTTLVVPGESRRTWVFDVVEIKSTL